MLSWSVQPTGYSSGKTRRPMATKPQFPFKNPAAYGGRFTRAILLLAIAAGVVLWLYAMVLMAGVELPPLQF